MSNLAYYAFEPAFPNWVCLFILIFDRFQFNPCIFSHKFWVCLDTFIIYFIGLEQEPLWTNWSLSMFNNLLADAIIQEKDSCNSIFD